MMIAKYVGGGAYLQGIPARDLAEEEWEALSQAQKDRALAHTHELSGRPKVQPVIEEAEDAEIN